MLRTRGQREQATVEEGGWAELPDELLAKVLEELQVAGRSAPHVPADWRDKPQAEGFRFSPVSATVRQVCAGWKAVHDALVTRLVLRRQNTDEAMGMLVRRFPAVVSLQVKRVPGCVAALTDEGIRAVTSSLPALTSLDLTLCDQLTDEALRAVSNLRALTSLDITDCDKVTDEGMRAVSGCSTLTSLDLTRCFRVTDEGVKAASSLPALKSLNLCGTVLTDEGMRAVSSCTSLTSLNLWGRVKVTAEGLRAVRNLHGLNSLNLGCCEVTDEVLRAVSILPALTSLDLRWCDKVTAAGVQALRSTSTAPSLHIESYV
jgi:hypothetical protein